MVPDFFYFKYMNKLA